LFLSLKGDTNGKIVIIHWKLNIHLWLLKCLFSFSFVFLWHWGLSLGLCACRYSATWAAPPVHFALVILEMESHELFAWGAFNLHPLHHVIFKLLDSLFLIILMALVVIELGNSSLFKHKNRIQGINIDMSDSNNTDLCNTVKLLWKQ
jgi:hypothetical protein